MEMNKDDAGGGHGVQTQNPNPKPNPNSQQTGGLKGKSCKGCLYYSSIRRSKSKNPTCVGFSRTLQQVPPYIVGETKPELSIKGRNIADFKYACVGYSVFLDNKDSQADPADKKMPFCVGFEVVMDTGPSTWPFGQVPPAGARAPKIEEGERAIPQTRTHKPPHPTGEEYLNRFTRNASLVASGVVKNLNKVGNYVKESLDDILYPYRRRPK
ncbi:hypothetical protein L6164_037560 [Bauhinia variegata]|uniref:Uncharacterized protein n=1 Tax=Bauhinia variegata TaxID=167791 RepID=A0ACB9KKR2_BAUVA|nr:hypothetical protein L6164_037560 [Bauhinia variegata]